MEAHPTGSLLSFLAAVPDPRSRRGRRHPLTAILGLVCCAIMCGARGYAAIAQWGDDQDIALMHRLGFTREPPTLGGIRKVLIARDPKAIEDALTRWAESLLGGAASTELGDDDPRIAAREVAAFLAGQYPDAGWSRTDHYAWMSRLLLELGITTLEELADLLRATDEQRIRDRMGYRYPPGAVRRLDDALLAGFGDRYVGLPSNDHRVDLLKARLERLRG